MNHKYKYIQNYIAQNFYSRLNIIVPRSLMIDRRSILWVEVFDVFAILHAPRVA